MPAAFPVPGSLFTFPGPILVPRSLFPVPGSDSTGAAERGAGSWAQGTGDSNRSGECECEQGTGKSDSGALVGRDGAGRLC